MKGKVSVVSEVLLLKWGPSALVELIDEGSVFFLLILKDALNLYNKILPGHFIRLNHLHKFRWKIADDTHQVNINDDTWFLAQHTDELEIIKPLEENNQQIHSTNETKFSTKAPNSVLDREMEMTKEYSFNATVISIHQWGWITLEYQHQSEPKRMVLLMNQLKTLYFHDINISSYRSTNTVVLNTGSRVQLLNVMQVRLKENELYFTITARSKIITHNSIESIQHFQGFSVPKPLKTGCSIYSAWFVNAYNSLETTVQYTPTRWDNILEILENLCSFPEPKISSPWGNWSQRDLVKYWLKSSSKSKEKYSSQWPPVHELFTDVSKIYFWTLRAGQDADWLFRCLVQVETLISNNEKLTSILIQNRNLIENKANDEMKALFINFSVENKPNKGNKVIIGEIYSIRFVKGVRKNDENVYSVSSLNVNKKEDSGSDDDSSVEIMEDFVDDCFEVDINDDNFYVEIVLNDKVGNESAVYISDFSKNFLEDFLRFLIDCLPSNPITEFVQNFLFLKFSDLFTVTGQLHKGTGDNNMQVPTTIVFLPEYYKELLLVKNWNILINIPPEIDGIAKYPNFQSSALFPEADSIFFEHAECRRIGVTLSFSMHYQTRKRKRSVVNFQSNKLLGIREILLNSEKFLISGRIKGILGVVTRIKILKNDFKESNGHSDSNRKDDNENKCAIILRDCHFGDVISLYYPRKLCPEGFSLGKLVKVQNIQYCLPANNKRPYLKALIGISHIEILGLVDVAQLKELCHLSCLPNNPRFIDIGNYLHPPLPITLLELLQEAKKCCIKNSQGFHQDNSVNLTNSRCLWTFTGKIIFIKKLSVSLRCKICCGSMNLFDGNWFCTRDGCPQNDLFVILWEISIVFDDGTAECNLVAEGDTAKSLLGTHTQVGDSSEIALLIEDYVQRVGKYTFDCEDIYKMRLNTNEEYLIYFKSVEIRRSNLCMTYEEAKCLTYSLIQKCRLSRMFSIIGRIDHSISHWNKLRIHDTNQSTEYNQNVKIQEDNTGQEHSVFFKRRSIKFRAKLVIQAYKATELQRESLRLEAWALLKRITTVL